MLLEDYLPLLLGPQVPHGIEHGCRGQMHHTLLRTDLVRKQNTSALLRKEKKRKGYLGLLARDTLQELKGSNGSSALTLGKIEGRRRRGRQRMRWMASPTQWT